MKEKPGSDSENLSDNTAHLPKYRRCRSQLPIIRINTEREMPVYSNADLFELLEEENVDRNKRS